MKRWVSCERARLPRAFGLFACSAAPLTAHALILNSSQVYSQSAGTIFQNKGAGTLPGGLNCPQTEQIDMLRDRYVFCAGISRAGRDGALPTAWLGGSAGPSAKLRQACGACCSMEGNRPCRRRGAAALAALLAGRIGRGNIGPRPAVALAGCWPGVTVDEAAPTSVATSLCGSGTWITSRQVRHRIYARRSGKKAALASARYRRARLEEHSRQLSAESSALAASACGIFDDVEMPENALGTLDDDLNAMTATLRARRLSGGPAEKTDTDATANGRRIVGRTGWVRHANSAPTTPMPYLISWRDR